MFRRRVQVVVILLVLVAVASLVVPGINRTRETANRARCQNNLKQIALAAHNYNVAYGKLPPLVDQGENPPTGQGLESIFAVLSPFLESYATHYSATRSLPSDYYAHSSVVYTYDWKGEPRTDNGGFANQFRPLFADPADDTAERLRDVPMTLPDGTTGYYATGSYAANGRIRWGSGGIPQLFTGGTTSKIMFAERPQACRTAAGDTIYNLWGLGIYSPHMPAFATLTPAEPPGLASTGQVAAVEPLPNSETDRDARIHFRIGRKDALEWPPDFPMAVQILYGGGPCDPRVPGSLHRICAP